MVRKTIEKLLLIIFVMVLCTEAEARLQSKKTVANDVENIRVAIAYDLTGNELKRHPIRYTNDGKIGFRGKKYSGRMDMFENGDGTLTVVNVLPLEEYLVGIVASEMPTDWPIEAIKAQSVAARTYAVYQKQAKLAAGSGSVYDVGSTVLDQVYKGSHDSERVRSAVEATKGEVLLRHGKPIKSFFNSTCGGQTESSLNVWGEEGMTTYIKDPYCERSPYLKWSYSISKAQLAEKLRAGGFPADGIAKITIDNRDNNPRAGIVTVDTGANMFYIQGSTFRSLLGYNHLKSTWFGVAIAGNKVVFEGRGFGHGVGMCQWGAKGMAEDGKDYREILEFYYPGTKIMK